MSLGTCRPTRRRPESSPFKSSAAGRSSQIPDDRLETAVDGLRVVQQFMDVFIDRVFDRSKLPFQRASPLRQENIQLPSILRVSHAVNQPAPLHASERRHCGRFHHSDLMAKLPLGETILFPESSKKVPLSDRHTIGCNSMRQYTRSRSMSIAQQRQNPRRRHLDISSFKFLTIGHIQHSADSKSPRSESTSRDGTGSILPAIYKQSLNNVRFLSAVEPKSTK